MNNKFCVGLGLFVMMLPMTAFAERPEIDCNSLPEADVQRFYELSGEMAQAADSENYEEALASAKQAMSMCTSDTYTEYMLARLYHLTNDCANAYYHYEILMNRPEKVKSENEDIYKALPKHFKQIKEKCGDVVTMEITCKTPGTKLQITGLTNSAIDCPYYGKVKPGAYQVMATKAGFMPSNETLTVADGGGKFTIDELREAGVQGFIRVRCPRGASKFILTASDGHVDEYVCPWEGEVPPDTYRIYLGGGDPKDAAVIKVGKKERVEHVIPAATSSSCSGTPMSGSGSMLGMFALLGLGGLALVSRRRTVRVK